MSYRMYHPVLVVDDEADLRELIKMTLTKMRLEVDTADGVVQAKKKLAENRYDLVLTDMRMPDGNGLEVVEYVNQHTDTPVAVITAYGNADHAVQALKAGAFDYIQKPLTLSQLRTLVKSAIKINDDDLPAPAAARAAESKTAPAPAREPAKKTAARKTAAAPREDRSLLGESSLIQEVRAMIAKLARSDVSVYISGESGTGKEVAARSIHAASARAAGAFVPVNCGAIPENLMESEFFGYKKGSFTGAAQDRDGFFQAADGGTLFLDEVADLPLSMQVKLLRAIQEKAVRRIGEQNETPINVRMICATHKDLAGEVAAGRFRQDLYYRLNIVSIVMPPLRELQEDLPYLIDKLLKKNGKNTKLTAAAQQRLLQYGYPGNFRELENILERATALAENNTITPEDLQIDLMLPENGGDDEDGSAKQSHMKMPDFVFRRDTLQGYLDDSEYRILSAALKQTGNNRTRAAGLLGISFRTMRFRMERLDLK